MVDNPIYMVIEKVWDILDNDSRVLALFKTGNMRRWRSIDAVEKEVMADADYPQLVVVPSRRSSPSWRRDSSGFVKNFRLNVSVLTGGIAVDELTEIQWAIENALQTGLETLRGTAWVDEDDKRVAVEHMELEENRDVVGAARGRMQWETVLQMNITIWISEEVFTNG